MIPLAGPFGKFPLLRDSGVAKRARKHHQARAQGDLAAALEKKRKEYRP